MIVTADVKPLSVSLNFGQIRLRKVSHGNNIYPSVLRIHEAFCEKKSLLTLQCLIYITNLNTKRDGICTYPLYGDKH